MLYVECKPDEALVHALGVPRREGLHFSGKDEVFTRLKRERGRVGMVDEDPRSIQPLYLRELRVVGEELGVRELRDERRDHRVLVLQPRLEEWVLAAARSSGIALHGLSGEGDALHKEINTRLDSFRKVIADLLSAESAALRRLREKLNAE